MLSISIINMNPLEQLEYELEREYERLYEKRDRELHFQHNTFIIKDRLKKIMDYEEAEKIFTEKAEQIKKYCDYSLNEIKRLKKKILKCKCDMIFEKYMKC